jgi:hypothetical protein
MKILWIFLWVSFLSVSDCFAATPIWIGNAPAVQQVGTFTVTAYDTATTYTLAIGGVAISTVGTGGTTTTTATALKNLLAASAHPYFSSITWTSNTNTITATATTAGVPFTATSSVNGGTGTFGAYTVVAASAGPSDWSTAANWSTGAVPVNGDDVVLSDSALNVAYGLNQSSVTLNSLRIMQSFTGLLGLNRSVFVTTADGVTTNSTYTEYRPLYLQVGLQGSKLVVIGENNATGGTTLSGSKRIMLDLGSSDGALEIQNTNSNPAETSRPTVRLKCNNSALNCYVRSAPGGFGVAIDQNNETSTLGTIDITDVSGSSKVVTGLGTTLTAWNQNSGTNKLQAASAVSTISIKAGTLQTEGSFAATTINLYSGTFKSHSTGTITTLNLYGGTVDFTGSSRARTVTTLVFQSGSVASLTADMSVLTVGTWTAPSTKFSFTAR